MRRRVLLQGGVLLGLATLVWIVVLIAPACACIPIFYERVSLEDVPPAYLVKFREWSHGMSPVRAWRFRSGVGNESYSRGYEIRGKSSWWQSRDIRVSESDAEEPVPTALEPATTP